jgi:signal transduction histidine kinase
MVLDVRGRVLYASPLAVDLLGGEVRHLRNEGDLPAESPRAQALNELRAVCETGTPVSRLITWDRERRHYLFLSASLREEDSSGRRVVAMVMDLTEVVAGGEVAEEFIRQLRHDLRGPLTSIKGAVDLLRTERLGSLSAGQTRLLELMDTAVGSMTEMVAKKHRSGPGPAPEGETA